MPTVLEEADLVRARLSLHRINQSIADIGSRCRPDDFVTRRLVAIALQSLAEIRDRHLAVADFADAFDQAKPAFEEAETSDQHTCRFITAVLRRISACGREGDSCMNDVVSVATVRRLRVAAKDSPS